MRSRFRVAVSRFEEREADRPDVTTDVDGDERVCSEHRADMARDAGVANESLPAEARGGAAEGGGGCEVLMPSGWYSHGRPSRLRGRSTIDAAAAVKCVDAILIVAEDAALTQVAAEREATSKGARGGDVFSSLAAGSTLDGDGPRPTTTWTEADPLDLDVTVWVPAEKRLTSRREANTAAGSHRGAARRRWAPWN